MSGRNHEITLLKLRHIRLREKYGEGEIPHEAKTGSGPVLLTCSFPYVRDWLNEHPFRNQPDTRSICNLMTGAPVKPEALWTMMKCLRARIVQLLESGSIIDVKEQQKLDYLLVTKRWNPYCIRHSAITSDSDHLPDYALKKAKVQVQIKVTLKYVFDEQTLLQLKLLFKEIDGNQQSYRSSYQNMASECKLRQIKFSHDKESKILSFTGKVEKKKMQTDTPDKYITHYLFECYDITPVPSSEVTNDMLAIWECGRRDERTVLNLLSRNITELDIVCDVQPNSKTTTYQIYARE